MMTGAQDAAVVMKLLRRDDAAKQKIIAQFPRFTSYAMDSDALAEASSRELAIGVLKQLGLTEAAKSVDPVTVLDCYVVGRQQRAAMDSGTRRRSALDERFESFVDKYLKE